MRTLAFNYWWIAYYLLTWFVLLLPVVIVVYYITNLFVRMLGYDVQPFPGGWIETSALQHTARPDSAFTPAAVLYRQALRGGRSPAA